MTVEEYNKMMRERLGVGAAGSSSAAPSSGSSGKFLTPDEYNRRMLNGGALPSTGDADWQDVSKQSAYYQNLIDQRERDAEQSHQTVPSPSSARDALNRIDAQEREEARMGELQKELHQVSTPFPLTHPTNPTQEIETVGGGVGMRAQAQNRDQLAQEYTDIMTNARDNWMTEAEKREARVAANAVVGRESYEQAAISDPMFKSYAASGRQNENGGYGVGLISPYMTDEEREIAYYYLGKDKREGRTGADREAAAYYDSIRDDLYKREGAEKAQNTWTPLLAVQGGLDQAARGTEGFFNAVTGNNEYVSRTPTTYATAYKQAELDEAGKIPGGLFKLGVTISNMLPSIIVSTGLNMALPGLGVGASTAANAARFAGNAVMGISAAGNAYNDMIEQGYTANQGRAMGALVGASETGLGELIGGIAGIGVGRLTGKTAEELASLATAKIGNAFVRSLANGSINYLTDAFGEAVEEGAQEILEPIFKSIITGEKFTPAEWSDVIEAAVLGGLSAGALNAVYYGSYMGQNIADAKKIKADNRAQQLIDLGQTYDATSVAGQLASRVKPGDGVVKMAMLLHEVKAGLSEQTMNDIRRAIEDKGLLPQDADTFAEVFADVVYGGTVTPEVEEILDSNTAVADAIAEVVFDRNSTVNQRYAQLEEVITGQRAAQTESTGITPEAARENINAALKARQASPFAIGDTTRTAATSETDTARQIRQARSAEQSDARIVSNRTVREALADKSKNGINLGIDEKTQNAVAIIMEDAVRNGFVSEEDAPIAAVEAVQYSVSGIEPSQWSDKVFASVLPDTVKSAIYNVANKTTNTGRVIKAGKYTVSRPANYSSLSRIQQASIDAVGTLVESGVVQADVRFFQSTKNDAGNMVLAEDVPGVGKKGARAPNGQYDAKTNTVWLDVNAGNNGEGTIMYTLSHEITHQIAAANPELFGKMVKAVSEVAMENGIDVVSLTRQKMDNDNLDYTAAAQDVVCDAMSRMFTEREENIRKLAEAVDRQDHGLYLKMKDFFRNVAKKLRAMYNSLKQGRQTAYSKQLDDLAKLAARSDKIADLWVAGVTDRSGVKENAAVAETEAESAVETANKAMEAAQGAAHSMRSMFDAAGATAEIIDGIVQVFDANGERIDKFTPAMVRKSAIGQLINYAVDKTISKKDADKQIKGLTDLLNLCIGMQDSEMVWKFASASLFSAIRSNSDAQYTSTVDFSTVCRKTQEMVTAMSEAMKRLKRGLTVDEVTRLQYRILQETYTDEDGNVHHGIVPCPVCYVFSRWAGIGGILDNMWRFQQKYAGSEYDTDPNDPTHYSPAMQEAIDRLNSIGDTQKARRKYLTESRDAEFLALQSELESKRADKRKYSNILKRKTATQEQKAEAAQMVKALDIEIKRLDADVKAMLKSPSPEISWLINVRAKPDYHENGYFDPNNPEEADILFDLNAADEFSSKKPLAWAYRTGRGASAGKAILPYAEMKLGDLILGDKNNSAKGNNLFKEFINGNFSKDQSAAIERAVARMKAQNLIGGQRFQSTSDFRYDYALDYLQTFFELQAIGGYMQTYTKIVEFAEMAASVGGDVNCSVMPLGSGYTADGNLVFSNVTGMDVEAAKLVSQAHDNVQLILVGINREHIKNALEDAPGTDGSYIGFVIPYHASGASISEFIAKLVGNLGETFDPENYKDFSPFQTDHIISDDPAAAHLRDMRVRLLTGGTITAEEVAELERYRDRAKDISGMTFDELRAIEKAAERGDKSARDEYLSWSAGVLYDVYRKMRVDQNAKETYGVKLSKSQAEMIMPHEYWNKSVTRQQAYVNGFIFRSYCAMLGLAPRFTGVKVKSSESLDTAYDEYYDFKDFPGYWKTLIDRPMYKNDPSGGNDGEYRPQQAVNVTTLSGSVGEAEPSANPLRPEYGESRFGKYKVEEPSEELAKAAAGTFLSEDLGIKRSTRDRTEEEQPRDEEYVRAVASGDMNAAQRMVDEAAKAAGYTIKVYRGDSERHNVFDTKRGAGTTQYGPGTYFTDGTGLAQEWANERAAGNGAKKGYVGEYYIQNSDYFDDRSVDLDAPQWKRVEDILRGYGVKESDMRVARARGFTGIAFALQSVGMIGKGKYATSDWANATIVNNILREAGYRGIVGEFYDCNQWVIFDPSEAKSAEAVTYDENGNVIPLSERFNAEEADVRYSQRDNLSDEEQARYDELKKMIEERTFERSEITLRDARMMYDIYNGDDEMWPLAEKVFGAAEKLGIKVYLSDNYFDKKLSAQKAAGKALGSETWIRLGYLNSDKYKANQKAATILHELIHTTTTHYLDMKPEDISDPTIAGAVKTIKDVYESLKKKEKWFSTEWYGGTSVDEFVAELADPAFRAYLKGKNLLKKITDSIKKLLGVPVEKVNNAYDAAYVAFDKLLDQYYSSPDVIAETRSAHRSAADPMNRWLYKTNQGLEEVAQARGEEYSPITRYSQRDMTLEEAREEAGRRRETVRRDFDSLQRKIADARTESPTIKLDPKSVKEIALRVSAGDTTTALEVAKAYRKMFMQSRDGKYTWDEFLKTASDAADAVADDMVAAGKSGGMISEEEIREQAYTDILDGFNELNVSVLAPKSDKVKAAAEKLRADVDAYRDAMRRVTAEALLEQGDRLREKYTERMKTRIAEIREGQKKKLLRQVEEARASERWSVAELRAADDIEMAKEVSRVRQQYERRETMKRATQVRRKIKSIIADLTQSAKTPSERRFIPLPLLEAVERVAEIIDTTGEKQDSKVAQKRESDIDAVRKLSREYRRLSESGVYRDDYSEAYSKDISDLIDALEDSVGQVPIRNMPEERLNEVIDTLDVIASMIRFATQQIGRDEIITNYQAGQRIIDEMDAVAQYGLQTGKLADILREWTLNPMRAARELSGFNEDSELVRLFNELNEGTRKADDFRMEALSPFDQLRADNAQAYEDAVSKPYDFGLVDATGKKLKITKMQAMQLVMTWEREQANQDRAHLQQETIIPDIDYQRKGDRAGAMKNAQRIAPVTQGTINTIIKKLNSFDLYFMQEARRYYNEVSKNAINSVSATLQHKLTALEDEYIPYELDRDYIAKEPENLKIDATLMGSGMLKSVVANANQPIVMRGLDAVLAQSIDQTAKIYGIAIPVRNLQKAWNMRQTVEDGGRTAKSAISAAWNEGANKMIEKAIADVQAPRRGESFPLSDLVRGAFVKSTLASNLSVWMKQAASYPTAGSILSTKALAKGLKDYVKEDKGALYARIDEVAGAAHWKRRRGLAGPEVLDIRSSWWEKYTSSKLGKFSPMNWIQGMDVATTAALFCACEEELRMQGVSESDEGYKQKLSDLYNRVIEETQPVYDPLHRAEIAKTTNELARNIFMFQTQPLQNSGILRDATMELRAARKRYGKDSDQAKSAGAKFEKAVASQVAAQFTFTAFTLIGAALLHKMGRYEDDDKELTAESVLREFVTQFGENVFSAIVPVIGSMATSLAEKIIGGSRYDVLSDSVVDKLNDTINAFAKLRKPTLEAFESVLFEILSYFGFPLKNAKNIIKGIRQNIEDIVEKFG